jgi:pimeloyl-ACP methyl ester carboxylesterase
MSPIPDASMQELTIFVHGYADKPNRYDDCILRLGATGSLKGHVFRSFVYNSRPFSRVRLDDVASALVTFIGDNVTSTISSINVIGQSLGGLVARRAFLGALGLDGDANKRTWSDKLARLILVATPNIGIRPDALGVLGRTAFSFGSYLKSPLQIMEALAGSSFITDLRILWAKARARGAWPSHIGIMQIVGADDRIVTTEDIVADGMGRFLREVVVDRDHTSIMRGDVSYVVKILAKALTSSPASLQQRDEADLPVVVPASGETQIKRRIVWLLHGIRDHGSWTRVLGAKIANDEATAGMKVAVDGYGYFPVLPFLLKHARFWKVLWFRWAYSNMMVKDPDQEVSIVAHSNGTYACVKAMEGCGSVRFSRIVLLSNVLPRATRWESLRGQFQTCIVMNGSCDVPVGVVLYGMAAHGGSDIGYGGSEGFESPSDNMFHFPSVEGGHGAPVNRWKRILKCLICDDRTLKLWATPKAGRGRRFKGVVELSRKLAAVCIPLLLIAVFLWPLVVTALVFGWLGFGWEALVLVIVVLMVVRAFLRIV